MYKRQVKKSVTAALEAMQEGKFYVRRPFENSYEANERFSRSLERKVELDLNELHNLSLIHIYFLEHVDVSNNKQK